MTIVSLISKRQEAPINVDIKNTGEGNFFVSLNEESYLLCFNFDMSKSGCVYNIQSKEVIPFYSFIENDQIYLWIFGRVYEFTNYKQETQKLKNKHGHTYEFSGVVKSPMPGSILKILVQSGDSVRANTPLIIMESMKMEMTITAPGDSLVSEIVCSVGQLVEMNAALVKLEALESEKVVS